MATTWAPRPRAGIGRRPGRHLHLRAAGASCRTACVPARRDLLSARARAVPCVRPLRPGAWPARPRTAATPVHRGGRACPALHPDMAGDYLFDVPGVEAAGLGSPWSRTRPAERFRNHYLTPLYGAALVGDEIWVANGASYTVTRVARQGGRCVAVERGEVTVGSWPAAVAWREPLPYGVVALRGSDTVGFIDRERGVLVDALWVGDEPTGLAISPDAATLYVSLATMREVADGRSCRRARWWPASPWAFDPRALALSADGAAAVCGLLSLGQPPARTPWAATRRGQRRHLGHRHHHPRRGRDHHRCLGRPACHRARRGRQRALRRGHGRRSHPVPGRSRDALPFIHELVVIAADPGSDAYGQVVRRADLTRQPSSAGPAVSPGRRGHHRDTSSGSRPSPRAWWSCSTAPRWPRPGRVEVGHWPAPDPRARRRQRGRALLPELRAVDPGLLPDRWSRPSP